MASVTKPIGSPAPPSTTSRPGGLLVFRSPLAFRRDLLGFLLRASRKKEDIVEIRVGSGRIFFLNSPTCAQIVLGNEADAVEKRASKTGPRAELLGEGLINSEGAFHLHERKLCTPAFQPHRIAAFADTMRDYAERAMSAWSDGETIDIAAEMNRLTLGIAGKTLFGTDLLGEADELRQALTAARDYIRDRSRGFAHIPLEWPTSANRRFHSAVARFDTTIYRLIDERRRAAVKGNDLLSLLLAAQDDTDAGGMTAKQVRDEAVNLFWGGHEPASITLTATWFLLAGHPEILTRMQAELDGVLGSRTVTVADLPSLTYTQQILKEALRLYPPIFAFGRQTLRPLDLGGHTVPSGANLLLSPYTLHRRPDIFPDPEVFDPERFAPEAEAGRSRFSYLPFGSGPRFCIGSHFAQMEALIVLATLGRYASFAPSPGRPVQPEKIITEPGRKPVPLVVSLRKPHVENAG